MALLLVYCFLLAAAAAKHFFENFLEHVGVSVVMETEAVLLFVLLLDFLGVGNLRLGAVVDHRQDFVLAHDQILLTIELDLLS